MAAITDFSSYNDSELDVTLEALRNEIRRRGTFADAEEVVRVVLTAAKEAGATKAQVGNRLTAIVNDIYAV